RVCHERPPMVACTMARACDAVCAPRRELVQEREDEAGRRRRGGRIEGRWALARIARGPLALACPSRSTVTEVRGAVNRGAASRSTCSSPARYAPGAIPRADALDCHRPLAARMVAAGRYRERTKVLFTWNNGSKHYGARPDVRSWAAAHASASPPNRNHSCRTLRPWRQVPTCRGSCS